MITRKLRLLALAAILILLVLSGCRTLGRMSGGGGGANMTGSSWPGMTLADDAVYMAFGDHVYKIDPATGNDIWRYPEEPVQRQAFYAPPAVSDDLIVVADYTGSVHGINPENGEKKWIFTAPVSGKFVGGAAIGDEYVYIGNVAGIMYAINKSDGTKKWEFSAQRDIWSAPLIDGETLYFTTLDRHLYALNAATGKLELQYPASDVNAEESAIGPMVGTPTLHENVLYFGDFNNSVHAFDLATESLKWTHKTASRNWVWSSPIFYEEANLLIAADVDGNVFALNPDTSDQEWLFETEGPIVSSPVLGEFDGNPAVFVTSADSNVYILNPATGAKIDEIDVQAEFENRFLFVTTDTEMREVALHAQPILTNDLIIVATHEASTPLMAFELDTLDQKWDFNPAE